MRKIQLLLLSFVILMSLSPLKAQENDKIALNEFDNSLLENLLVDKVNEFRTKSKLENLTRNTTLDKAAGSQADDFLSAMKIDKEDDIIGRVKKAGGKGKPDWNAIIISIAKGKDMKTYAEAANEIASKFTSGKESSKKILVPGYFYTGISIKLDSEKKKVYVSQVLGGLDVAGGDVKKLRKTLPVKFTNKAKYPQGTDKDCKTCEKFTKWKALYDGIEIKNGKVYLSFDNLKELKQIMKRDNDAIAVEFVLKQQYRCNGENIYDASLPTRGYLVKPIGATKVLAKNEAEGGEKAKNFYGSIGKLKKSVIKKLPEDYEINVCVIQNGLVCKRLKRSYVDDGGQKSLTILSIFPDSMIMNPGGWVPTNEKGVINFKIPFEQSKSEFKVEDIRPLLDALNEPKYKINEVFIEAHSSLEGDSAINTKLQQKRAESILKAMMQLGKTDSNLVKPQNIKTTNGWNIFQEQIKNNKEFAYFKGLSYDDVKSQLKDQEVFKKLDTLLRAQRYAAVKMNVTYDVTGANEEPFVVSQMKKAIDAKDGAKALKIQQYAIRQKLAGKFKYSNFSSMNIPNNPNFSSLSLNQIFLDNYYNQSGELLPELKAKFDTLYKRAPDNGFIAFNKFLYEVKFGSLKDEKQIRETQKGIDALYSSKVPQKFNDALNLEYQFKIMSYFDSVDNKNPMINESLNRIKKVFNVEGSSWQNALKLGYIFIAYNDLKYATKILAPFIEAKDVNPELYFTYLTAAAPDEKIVFTKDFRIAMDKAREADKTRFCKLFGAPKLSFQYLENPLIKESYCNSCY